MTSRLPSRRALSPRALVAPLDGPRRLALGAALLAWTAACGGPQRPAVENPATAAAAASLPPAPALPPPPPLPPPQESLREFIPERAVLAAVVRRNALAPLRELFTQDPVLQQELGAYLRQSLGVDLTELSGLVFFATSLDGPPRGAVVLRLPGAGVAKLPTPAAVKGQDPLPPHLGVPLTRLDNDAVAASLPGALVLGSADAVREAIAVQQRLAGALSQGSPLGALLTGDPRVTDLEIAVAANAVNDAGMQASLARFGATGALLTYENVGGGRLTLVIHGDHDKLTLAKGVLMAGVEVGLKELEGKKESAKQGNDIAKAAGMIFGYHYGRRLAQELEPRIVGHQMVVQYQFPVSLRGGLAPYLGVMAAIAVPAFQKYIDRSKALSTPPVLPKRGL